MAFSIILFCSSWVGFLLFADKSKIFLFWPTCLLGMYLSSTVDFFAHHYDLWNYPAPTDKQTYWYHLLQQIGIYPIVVYLFLQKLPKAGSWRTLTRYIFLWSIFAGALEWLALRTGFMEHKNGWSYLCDWILFILFYLHHKWYSKSLRGNGV